MGLTNLRSGGTKTPDARGCNGSFIMRLLTLLTTIKYGHACSFLFCFLKQL